MTYEICIARVGSIIIFNYFRLAIETTFRPHIRFNTRIRDSYRFALITALFVTCALSWLAIGRRPRDSSNIAQDR